MKETKISYYKIQYQSQEAEIFFPEKKSLAISDRQPKLELKQECAMDLYHRISFKPIPKANILSVEQSRLQVLFSLVTDGGW